MSAHPFTVATTQLDYARAGLLQWTDQDDRDGRTYIGAGYDAVKHIDAAITVLQTAREELVRELRADRIRRYASTSMRGRRAQPPALTLSALGIEDRVATGEARHPLEG